MFSMKKVLVLHYSQSGQLTEILKSLTSGMNANNVELEFVDIRPKNKFPFPWKGDSFFEQMPESVLGKPCELDEITTRHDQYDLIILGYQVWFLNPSVPFNSFLQSDKARTLLNNTPVVTVAGVRNMWVMAQEKIKNELQKIGARLVGNIILEDKNPNLISVVTIQHWLFTAKKSRFLGFFPLPGVSQEDIDGTKRFGTTIEEALLTDDCNNLQEKLVKQNAVRIVDTIVFVEKRATTLFGIWANLIEKKGTTQKKKKLWLRVFNYYLLFAIFIISPIVILLYSIGRLFFLGKVKKEKLYYQGVKLK